MGAAVMGSEKNSQKHLPLQIILLAFFFSVSVADEWAITVPQQITAFKHSCLVIPCTFDYPENVDERQKNLIWYRGEDVAFDSRNPNEASGTSLVGSHRSKNCSLLIRNVTEMDTGRTKQWMFRAEFDNTNKYSFYNHEVTINLEINPPDPELYGYRDEITEGETVTLECKTTHNCNIHPPTITWSPEYGRVNVEHKDLKEGKWEVTSRHTFTASHHLHGRHVTCSVQYVPGMESKTKKTPRFNVLYSPKNTNISISDGTAEVVEGEQVTFICSSDSKPPISSYTWHRLTGSANHSTLSETGSTFKIWSAVRHEHSYYCTARNSLGAQNSTVMRLNVMYTPEISSDSICHFTFTQFECWCVVKANPPAAITWQFPDRNVSSAEKDVSSDPFLNGYVTKSRHKGTGSPGTSITCSASNKEGTTHLLLSNQLDRTMLTLVVVVPAVLILIALALSCAVYHYRRTRSAQQRESTKNTTTEANKLEVKKHEVELESSSCDYENEYFEEQPKLTISSRIQEVKHPDGLYETYSQNCDESIYQNC
ncbi:sialic acid-binding Ig-like lectin 14 [Lissotriton helveticus]